jgi:PPOX class probable F420-dependent enzyme
MQEPAMVIDPGTDKGARVDRALREDLVAWLITVGPGGTPVPTPVWFWWDGETVLVYSQRDKPKLRHIAANPTVAFALRTDELGDRIIVLTATAEVDDATPPADELGAYVAKYSTLIERLGADPGSFAAEYAVPIRIRPTRLRAWWVGDG